jgi:hypothetical protein
MAQAMVDLGNNLIQVIPRMHVNGVPAKRMMRKLVMFIDLRLVGSACPTTHGSIRQVLPAVPF